MSRADTLSLPATVDAAVATRLHRELAGRTVTAVDFAAVAAIDSAGLALIAELAARAPAKLVLAHVTPRFAQLCAAHRVERELLG